MTTLNQRRISKLTSVMDNVSTGGNGDPLSLGLIGMRAWYVAVDTSHGISPANGESILNSTWKLPLSRVALRNSAGIIPSEMLPSYVDDVIFGQFFDDTNGQYFVSLPDSASSATESSSSPVVYYRNINFPGSSVTLDGNSYTSFTVELAASGKIYGDIYTYAATSGTVQYRFSGNTFVPILGSYTYAPGNGISIDPILNGMYPIRAKAAAPIVFDSLGYIWHEYSGVSPSDDGVSAGVFAAASPEFGGTVNLVGIHATRYGHVSVLSDYVLTIPNTVATDSTNGLMSSAYVNALGSAVQSIIGDYIISPSKTGTSYTLTHKSYNNGTVMYGTTSVSVAFGDNVSVPGLYVDTYGHIREITNYTVTFPSSVANSSANGLMSSSSYILLNSLGHASRSSDWIDARTFYTNATSYVVPYLLPLTSQYVGAGDLFYDNTHNMLHVGNYVSAAPYSSAVMLGAYVGDHALIRSIVSNGAGSSPDTFIDILITDSVRTDTPYYQNAIRFLENGLAGNNRQLLRSQMINSSYCALYVGGPDSNGDAIMGLYGTAGACVGFSPNPYMSIGYFMQLPVSAPAADGLALFGGYPASVAYGTVSSLQWGYAVRPDLPQTFSAVEKAQARKNIGAAASLLVQGSITPADTPVPLTLYEQNGVTLYIQANSLSAIALYITATPAVNSGFRATKSGTVQIQANASNSSGVLIGTFAAQDLQSSGGYGHIVLDWTDHFVSVDLMIIVLGSYANVSVMVNYI